MGYQSEAQLEEQFIKNLYKTNKHIAEEAFDKEFKIYPQQGRYNSDCLIMIERDKRK